MQDIDIQYYLTYVADTNPDFNLCGYTISGSNSLDFASEDSDIDIIMYAINNKVAVSPVYWFFDEKSNKLIDVIVCNFYTFNRLSLDDFGLFRSWTFYNCGEEEITTLNPMYKEKVQSFTAICLKYRTLFLQLFSQETLKFLNKIYFNCIIKNNLDILRKSDFKSLFKICYLYNKTSQQEIYSVTDLKTIKKGNIDLATLKILYTELKTFAKTNIIWNNLELQTNFNLFKQELSTLWK